MNHANNVYLAVTLDNPSTARTIDGIHPSIFHAGQVGALDSVHLYGVPRSTWAEQQQEILSVLKGVPGVQSVDVQKLRQRNKRA